LLLLPPPQADAMMAMDVAMMKARARGIWKIPPLKMALARRK